MDLKRESGLTLIELMVTTSMLILVSSIVLFNYPRFSESYRLDRAALEMSSILSEAESRALGIAGSTTGVFPGFGVYFDISAPREYILFSDDNPANGFYNPGEEIKRVPLESPLPEIVDLCVNTRTSPPGTCGYSTLDVVYLFKIGPEPVITVFAGGASVPNYSDAEVIIEGPTGAGRGVIPWVTGYVEILRK